MNYIYETHLHTSEASLCGNLPGAEYIDFMKSRGYSGIIVTDHFFNGNTCISHELSWKERIEAFYQGYENARKAAEGTDFSVFFGLEVNYDRDEYLLYGLDKQWLLDRPDLLSYSRKELYDAVKESGGLMIQAHPFRERFYITEIHLSPDMCDGIEVYNAGNVSWQNALAHDYAKEHNLPVIAGSDVHFKSEDAMGGVSVSYPLHSIQDFVQAFHRGDFTAVSVREDNSIVPVDTLEEECNTVQKSNLPIIFHKE